MNKIVLKEINRRKINNIIKTVIAFIIVLMLLCGAIAEIIISFADVLFSL